MPLDPTPPVNCRHGAPMGRHGRAGGPGDAPLYLRKIRLNGGYDSGGAYWGARLPGESLYWYSTDDSSTEGYLDAKSRDHAKAQLRETYGDHIRFKR